MRTRRDFLLSPFFFLRYPPIEDEGSSGIIARSCCLSFSSSFFQLSLSRLACKLAAVYTEYTGLARSTGLWSELSTYNRVNRPSRRGGRGEDDEAVVSVGRGGLVSARMKRRGERERRDMICTHIFWLRTDTELALAHCSDPPGFNSLLYREGGLSYRKKRVIFIAKSFPSRGFFEAGINPLRSSGSVSRDNSRDDSRPTGRIDGGNSNGICSRLIFLKYRV